MGSQAVAPVVVRSELAIDNTAADVVINLVAPSCGMEGQSVPPRKRTRKSLVGSPPPLGVVYAESSRLCLCSRYFDACMSERWTASTTREFTLEAHTEVRFYQDCFRSMHSHSRPVLSVATCMELLKVASQIQYDQGMENGVRFLSAVPWIAEEEEQIRSFYHSWQLPSNITSDLSKRLQAPSNGAERQENLFRLIQQSLKYFLRTINSDLLVSSFKSRRQCKTVFIETLNAIVRGSGEPGKYRKLLPLVTALILGEAEKVLSSIKKGYREETPQDDRAIWVHQIILLDQLGNFGWLYDAVRSASFGQPMVELLLKDRDFPALLWARFQAANLLGCLSVDETRWATLMSTIFRDVLDGRLFLKASERFALFKQWSWLFKVANLDPNAPSYPQLLSNFMMGFPHEFTEEVFRCWVSNLEDLDPHADCDLSEAHVLWMKHLVSKADKGPANEPGCSNQH